MHMLMATDVRTSKTAKIRKLYCYNAANHCMSMCSVLATTAVGFALCKVCML